MEKLFIILLTVSIAFSCSKESKNNEKDIAAIELSFQIAGNPLLKSAVDTSLDITTAIISIQNEKEELIYNNEEVKVYKMGDFYISNPLSVKVGTYKIIRFFLVNSSGNVIYASPLKESSLNYMVKNPLPISFSVSKDQVLKLSPEVLSVKEFTPMDFGYSTFSFNIINSINFQLAVFEYSEVAKNFVLTDAKLQITTIDSFSYETFLQAKTNLIIIPEKPGYYSLIISKAGYNVYNRSISKDSIKLYAAKPMEVILTKKGAAPSLVAYYKFNYNLTDISGFCNHGLYYGRGLYEEGRNIDSTSAITLNGSTDYVKVKNSTSLNPTEQITLCAWYYTVPFYGNGANALINKMQSDSPLQYQYHLGVTGNLYVGSTGNTDWRKFSFYLSTTENNYPPLWAGTDGNQSEFTKYDLYKWYFVVGTYDGKNMKLYVNGDLTANRAASGGLIPSNFDVCFGKPESLNRSQYDFTSGKIDEIRIYNTALTPQEILSLYNQN